jgi:hypothetical protein
MGRDYSCSLTIKGPDISAVVESIGTPDTPYDPVRVNALLATGNLWGERLDDKGRLVKEEVNTPVYHDGQKKVQQPDTVDIHFQARNGVPGKEIDAVSKLFPENEFEFSTEYDGFESIRIYAIKNGTWDELDTRDYFHTHSFQSPEQTEVMKNLDAKYDVQIQTDVFAGDSSTTGTILIDQQRRTWNFSDRQESLRKNEEAYAAVVRALQRPLIRGVKKQGGIFPQYAPIVDLDNDPQIVAADALDDATVQEDQKRRTAAQEDIFVPAPMKPPSPTDI